MSDRDTFLRAIIAAPDDDGPRLVYADWLEEHGDTARAEFIRVQIALANADADDPARDDLIVREATLLRDHQRTWSRELPVWARIGCWFSRGFPERVRVEAIHWATKADELLAAAPVCEASFTRWTGIESTLAECESLARLRHLELRDPSVGGPEVVAGLRALLVSPHLTELRGLAMPHLGLDPGAVVGVLSALAAHNLGLLDLSVNPIMTVGAMNLVALPVLGRLRELDLTRCGLNDRSVAYLPNARFAGQLHSLKLDSNPIEANGARALAAFDLFAGVRVLSLNELPIGPDGVAAVVGCRRLANVRELQLRRTGGSDPGARAIASAGQLTELRILGLSNNGITGDGVRYLVAASHLARLVELDLSRNPIRGDGVIALAGARGLAPRRLNLQGCEIGKVGITALAESPVLSQVRALGLSGNAIGDAGADAILDSPYLSRLRWMSLGQTETSAAVHRRFRERFPDAHFV